MRRASAVLFALLLVASFASAQQAGGTDNAQAGDNVPENKAERPDALNGGLSGMLPSQASDQAKQALNMVDNLLSSIFGS